MVVLIIFPVILQTNINVIMLSIGGRGGGAWMTTCPLSVEQLDTAGHVMSNTITKQINKNYSMLMYFSLPHHQQFWSPCCSQPAQALHAVSAVLPPSLKLEFSVCLARCPVKDSPRVKFHSHWQRATAKNSGTE